MSENKKDISSEYNSVFDENITTDGGVFENREYQQALFGQKMDGVGSEVLYTRSQYIKDYTDIVENYKKEQILQIECIIMTFIALLIINFLAWLTNGLSGVIGNAITYIIGIVKLFSKPVAAFIIVGFIVRFIKLIKLRKNALERLEKTKREHMEAGTYDAGK